MVGSTEVRKLSVDLLQRGDYSFVAKRNPIVTVERTPLGEPR
jgi:hypothetical protein